MSFRASFIQKLLVLYVIIWTISPPLQIDNIYRFAALGAVGLWFILNIPYNVRLERIHVLAIVFMLLVIMVALVESGGQFGKILGMIAYYMLVLAFLIAHSYKDRWNELSGIIPIVLILLIYFNYQSYQAVASDPAIARLIVRNDVATYSFLRRGVGGYGLLYGEVCVFPAVIAWTISAFKHSKIKFFIGAVWAVTYLMFLFNSGYTIALVTSIVGLIILFFYKRNSIVLAVVITAIMITLLIWLIGYNDGFRNALLDFFDGTKVAKKIEDIYLSIVSTDTADSIQVRMDTYSASIGTIFSYPIIGSLWGGEIGVHSTILDTFAKYGIFGGYVFLKIVFDFCFRIKRSPLSKKDVGFANATFIVFLLVLLLDAMAYNFVMMMLIVIPVLHNDIVNWRNKDEHSLDSQPDSVRSLANARY